MQFRACGECNACCKGHLIGNAYGNKFGNGIPCKFLVKESCTIYKDRPAFCQNFQCGWSQGITSNESRPDQSGVIISVEIDADSKQFLKLTKIKNDIAYSVMKEIEDFCSQNNTYWRF